MSEYEELNAKAYIQGLKDGKEIGRADVIDKIIDMYNSNPDIDTFTLIRNLLKEQNK